jgi:hypothetical protein
MANPIARDGLDPSYADARLLAAVLDFADQRNADVAIVTAYGGLQRVSDGLDRHAASSARRSSVSL